MERLRTSVLLLCASVVAGCAGSAASSKATLPNGERVPERISAERYGEALRTYHGLPFDHPGRAELRERLMEHLDRRTPAILRAGNYEQAVEHLDAMVSLLSPEDFARGDLPRALEVPARWILKRASRRGDEGRAMAALLVLRLRHPDEPRYRREYRRVALWGRRARSGLDNPLERLTGLIEVWEEHARLTPAPEVLETTAKLHVQRRDAVTDMLKSGEGLSLGGPFGQSGFGTAPHHLLRRAPFEVAAVYLRHGDVSGAITHLRAMGQVTDLEGQLLRVLEDIRAEGDHSSDAVVELAEAYRGARPDVALGLCHSGLRRMPGDPRFPTCLARVAAEEERYADATAWYARAIELAPGARALYDEALEKLNDFIERGLFDSDSAEARELASRAEQILEARERRWPKSAPPVGPAELQLLIGTLAMNAGDSQEARRRFERSLAADVTTGALLQLGLLEQRTGHTERAAELYRRALEATPDRSPAEALERAEILERLADIHRDAGRSDQAGRMYEQALELLDRVAPELEGPPLSLVQVRRGVVLDRLGRHEDATSAFVTAMAAAPHWRETYAGILSHLVVVHPDPELAHRVFRRAQRQLTLEPEWKVYFALWVELIAGRAGEAPERDVRELLRELGAGTAWWARLAKFGAGALPYEDLLDDASSVGERAEAHFYEGARRLAAGDRAGALRAFERVLATRMVSFYEFVMARELASRAAPVARSD
ncbi:MAG: tetratricopeptide repeat protein [Myxococcota bacterium]